MTPQNKAPADDTLRSADEALVTRLRRHAGEHLPLEAVPARFVIVDDLPTLPNGKIDRNALADLAGEAPEEFADQAEGCPDAETGLLARLFATAMSRAHVGVDDDLTLLGVGSLLLMQVCAEWTACTGRRVDATRLAGNPTVRTIAASPAALRTADRTGVEVEDCSFDVPLDHDDPRGSTLSVFARIVRRHTGESVGDRPYLLFLQGGPGAQCPDPRKKLLAWLDVALDHFQVVLLDQRGGGQSSPDTVAAAAAMPAPAAASRIRCFRADSIVRDAEILRKRILRTPTWTILAESYGGAIALTYVSLFPDSLDRVLVSSGLVGPFGEVEDVLRETLAVSKQKNAEYYRRYPEDAEAVGRIVSHLEATEVHLAGGDRLSPGRFAMLGVMFGFAGGMEAVHDLVGTAWADAELASDFLDAVATRTIYSPSPLFYLQEYVYGVPGRATNWAARRLCSTDPEFGHDARPFPFTGEVFFPWMFHEIALLRPFADAADELARYTDWTPLYDPVRLAANTVPIYAVAVADDLYAPLGRQIRTAQQIGCCWLMLSPARDHTALMNDRMAFAPLLAFASNRGGPR